MNLLNLFRKKKPQADEEPYGIDKNHSHPRAKKLVSEAFFWDCSDELSPFGSDEGDTALSEYRMWRKENPKDSLINCLVWTIEGIGEIDFSEYSESMLQKEKIQNQLDDSEFDDQQYIFTLDISVIATGFGQLVDEGKIEPKVKPIIELAIRRLIIWSQLQKTWTHGQEFVSNLNVLQRVLLKA